MNGLHDFGVSDVPFLDSGAYGEETTQNASDRQSANAQKSGIRSVSASRCLIL